MSYTLHQHIYEYIRRFTGPQGAWLVWCDPRKQWQTLLEIVTKAHNIPLVVVTEECRGEAGNLALRWALQKRIEAQESFVLYVTAGKHELGWLWAQALLAEERYEKPLREQLQDWGWRPQTIGISNEEVMWLAKHNLEQDPVTWGGGGLQPDIKRLLELLASGVNSSDDNLAPADDPILNLTINEAGLSPFDRANPERWRLYALVRLLVAQAHSIAPEALNRHEYLVAPDKRAAAIKLLDDWLDSVRLSKGLPERILEADRILGLHNYLGGSAITPDVFVSQSAERTLFASTCTMLAQLHGRELLDTFVRLGPLFEQHKRGLWGDDSQYGSRDDDTLRAQALPWSQLARLSHAVELLLAAAPRQAWANPTGAINWYVTKGWQVEKAGEELLRHINRTTPELLACITPLRTTYRARWEEYMIQWSDVWTAAGCPAPTLPGQGNWLLEHLKGSRPIAVLMIDALRYDIGMGLKEQLNRSEGVERASVFPARTALPSITALGMGMALPVDEKDLRAEVVNGAWQLYYKDSPLNLSLALNRREWLRTQLHVLPEFLLTLADAVVGAIPEPQRRRNRLFLFDDAIDRLGHDEELELQGTHELQQRYLTAITRLYERGWTHILIVTDHGFIHWLGSAERRLPPPAPNPAYISRRAVAYPHDTALEGPQGLAPGGKWRVAVASGVSCFRTYGSLGYFHGGASLQEWIVPCIKIEWPATARPIDVAIVPLGQLLSLRPKITLEVRREGLFASDEALARHISISLIDGRTGAKLFTSEVQLITPDQDRVSVQVEPVSNAEAARGTPLRIELRDARTEELLDMQTTILMVPIENW